MANDVVLARAVVQLAADTTNFANGVRGAQGALGGLTAGFERLGRRLTLGVTLPLAGIGAAAVATAGQLEQELNRIVALVGIPREQVQSFEEDVRDLGVEFGRSATEVAQALFFITSAGQRGAVAIDTLEAALIGSVIGLGEVATVGDAATSAMNAFAASGLTATRATEILAATVREGKLEADSLAPSLGRVTGFAAALGISFEQLSGTIAVLSRTGLSAELAITTLSGVLGTLVSGSPQAEAALRSVGLSLEELREIAQGPQGLIDVFRLLNDRLGGIAGVRDVIPNLEALRGALNVLAQDATIVDTVMANVANSVGILDEALAESDGVIQQFNRTIAAFNDIMISVGRLILPVVTPAFQLLADTVRGVANFFESLPGPIRAIAGVFVLLAASIGPLILALTTLSGILANVAIVTFALTVFGRFSAVLAGFGAAVARALPQLTGLSAILAPVATRVGLVAAALLRVFPIIGQVTTAITLAIFAWDRFGDRAVLAIEAAANVAARRFADLRERLREIREDADATGQAFFTLADQIVDAFSVIGTEQDPVVQALRQFATDVNDAVGAIADFVSPPIQETIDAFDELDRAVIQILDQSALGNLRRFVADVRIEMDDLATGVENGVNEITGLLEIAGRRFAALSEIDLDFFDPGFDPAALNEITAELTANLARIGEASVLLGDDFDTTSARLAVFQQAFSDMLDLGLSRADPVLRAVAAAIGGLQDQLGETQNLERVQEVFDNLARRLEVIDAEFQLFEISGGVLQARLNAVEQAAISLVNQGLDPMSQEVQTLKTQYDELAATLRENVITAQRETNAAVAEFVSRGRSVEEIAAEISRELEGQAEALREQRVELERSAQQMEAVERAGLSAARSVGAAFGRFFNDAEFGFERLVRTALRAFARIAIAAAFPGGGIAAGFLSGLFAGVFQGGGFIPPGRFGLVGEAGPEFITAGSRGATVTPNAGVTNVNLGINVTGGTAAQVEARMFELLRTGEFRRRLDEAFGRQNEDREFNRGNANANLRG